MKRNIVAVCFLIFAQILMVNNSALAHNLPVSYIDLKFRDNTLEVTIESSAFSFANELEAHNELELLTLPMRDELKKSLKNLLSRDLTIWDGHTNVPFSSVTIEPLLERKDLRIVVTLPWNKTSDVMEVNCALFSLDVSHKTFLNIYVNGDLKKQGNFDHITQTLTYRFNSNQSLFEVIKQFINEGIQHIFKGPDHILFIVGLLLLGGTTGRLLKIVTAFTLSHSISLVLATLQIVTPSPRIIEPIIALSIIFVGIDAIIGIKNKKDLRVKVAFCFGFIHGFGFANVLRQMDLPTSALGWSLASFNLGVEIGQACIVLAVAPILTALYRRNQKAAHCVVTASAMFVISAGSYWFIERVFTY